MRCVLNGLNINYIVIGGGRPLLILHGWGSRSNNWQRIGEMLAEKGIKVIIPDLPGFGQSDKPPRAWNLDDYCDFIEEFVKVLNLENFSLLAHSFGGALAVKCSLKIPEKIDKLFLVSAACFRRKSLKVKLLKFISKFFKIKTPFLKKFFYRKSDYLSTEGVMRDTYLKIIAEDLSDILSQIQMPTIIIWGEKDNITPIKQAYLIKSKIKDSKLEILPSTGHNLNLNAQQRLVEIVKQYI